MQTFNEVPANVKVHIQTSVQHQAYVGLVFKDNVHVATTIRPRNITKGGHQRCAGDVLELARQVAA